MFDPPDGFDYTALGFDSGNDEGDDQTDEFETTPTSELARHVGDDGEQILENENIFREKSK